jgi:hypothetical protein
MKCVAKAVRDLAVLFTKITEQFFATIFKRFKIFSQQCVANGRGNMKGEAKYRALYDDIVANKQLWMAFFDERDNYVHAEHTCGILVRMLLPSKLKPLQLTRATHSLLHFMPLL